jgi:hypothetical protein
MVHDVAVDLYVPVFYVLVTAKTQWTYWFVLNQILITCKFKFEPEVIHCDFEMALMNAIKEQFSDTLVVGCFFHLKQAWLKKMKELDIPKEERKLAIAKGVVDILCLIPISELERGIWSFII